MTISNIALQNHLLSALPESAQLRLCPHLEYVTLQSAQVLHESSQTRSHVYFPIDAIVSLLNVAESGLAIEVSKVGNEGVLGISAFLGAGCSPWRAVVQSSGRAYRIASQRMREEFDRHGETMLLMLRYTQVRSVQMAQTAACNRHHSINQQLCRWLLQSLDRISDNRLWVTQESIANMLGVRREGITEAAGKLQRCGAIDYRRGKIVVLDRPHLEHLSCECYASVKKETDRLLPLVADRQTAEPVYRPQPRVARLAVA